MTQLHRIFKVLMLVTSMQATHAQGLFKKGDITLRLHPLGFADADGGLQAGVGYRFANRWSVNTELGFLFIDAFERLGYGESLRGFKWKQDIRYHSYDFWKFSRTFHGIDLLFKNVGYRKEASVGINCIQGNCDYYMIANYKEVKQEFGVAFKGGFEIPLSSKGDPWSLEMYSGFGYKLLQFRQKGLPPGATYISGGGSELLPWESESQGSPYIPGGIKIIYKLPVR